MKPKSSSKCSQKTVTRYCLQPAAFSSRHHTLYVGHFINKAHNFLFTSTFIFYISLQSFNIVPLLLNDRVPTSGKIYYSIQDTIFVSLSNCSGNCSRKLFQRFVLILSPSQFICFILFLKEEFCMQHSHLSHACACPVRLVLHFLTTNLQVRDEACYKLQYSWACSFLQQPFISSSVIYSQTSYITN
jgi:hypothetical protein